MKLLQIIATKMKQFIITNLLLIHSGNYHEKFLAIFKLALVPAAGISVMEKLSTWYIHNHFFIILLIGGLLGDLVMGIWKHLKKRTFSFKKLITGFIEKAGIIVVAYFLCESLIQIISDAELGTIYFKFVSKIMLFIFPAGNAFVNMGIVTDGKFPPLGFLKRFEKFNNDLDPTAFKFDNPNNPKTQQDEENNNADTPL